MILLIKTKSGEEKELNMPFNVNDVTFSQFCDFKEQEFKFLESVKSIREAESKENNIDIDGVSFDAILSLSMAVSSIYGEHVSEVPFRLKNETTTKLITDGFIYTPDNVFQVPITLERLYAHFVNLVNSYRDKVTGKNYSFIYKGNRYYVNKDKFLDMLTGERMTTGEVLEVLQVNVNLKKRVNHIASDANINFALGLSEFALLCRRKNEQLPSDRGKLTKWRNKRVLHLQDLRLDKVLDVRFFLRSTIIDSNLNPTTNYSLKASRPQRLRNLKKRIGVNRTTRRS